MFIIEGKYNKVEIYADSLDSQATGVVKKFCDTEDFKDSVMVLMPDAHAGKGCPIGTTLVSFDFVIPKFVGVDIGCGVTSYIVEKGKKKLNLDELDKAVRSNPKEASKNKALEPVYQYILNSMDSDSRFISSGKFDKLKSLIFNQFGTLGGGNHFIELGEYDENHYILTVHSGSRGLGSRTAEYHQNRAAEICKAYCSENLPYEFAYYSKEYNVKDIVGYLVDTHICSFYANLNRKAILDNIIERCKKNFGDIIEIVDCKHNYIETNDVMIGPYLTRKGAIKTTPFDRVVIPMNMRDGVVLGTVKKSLWRWNYSAPHGAGRQYSRSETLNHATLNGLKKEMSGIYTTCLSKDILDEAPIAYKPMESIIPKLDVILEDIKICKPIYNYKVH